MEVINAAARNAGQEAFDNAKKNDLVMDPELYNPYKYPGPSAELWVEFNNGWKLAELSDRKTWAKPFRKLDYARFHTVHC
jgi:hypothetical protein